MSGQDQEIEDLRAGVSCATLLERRAWKLDKTQSTRHCWKYRCGAGGLVIVNHGDLGWWNPRSQAKGDVFALAQFLEPGLNFGQVRQLLRTLSGIAPSFPVALAAQKEKKPELSPAERWTARRSLTRGSPTWCYLARTRALEVPVLVAAARADVLREGPYGSAWFAHRDAAATIVGIEMRGPEYRGFSADGDKTLFQLPGRLPTSSVPVTRLVVCEAPIDAMSLAGIERLRTDTLYVATAGGIGPHLAQVAQGQPVTQSAEHHEGDDVAGQAGPVQHAAAALVELPPTGPAAEAAIAPCRDLRPHRHRHRSTVDAVHPDCPSSPSLATLRQTPDCHQIARCRGC